VVPSRAGLVSQTILLRLQQDEFWPNEATCLEGEEAVADWLPSSIQQVPKRKNVQSGQLLK
jgi:hypothetical protein